jgi:hypothetical protein
MELKLRYEPVGSGVRGSLWHGDQMVWGFAYADDKEHLHRFMLSIVDRHREFIRGLAHRESTAVEDVTEPTEPITIQRRQVFFWVVRNGDLVPIDAFNVYPEEFRDQARWAMQNVTAVPGYEADVQNRRDHIESAEWTEEERAEMLSFLAEQALIPFFPRPTTVCKLEKTNG